MRQSITVTDDDSGVGSDSLTVTVSATTTTVTLTNLKGYANAVSNWWAILPLLSLMLIARGWWLRQR